MSKRVHFHTYTVMLNTDLCKVLYAKFYFLSLHNKIMPHFVHKQETKSH